MCARWAVVESPALESHTRSHLLSPSLSLSLSCSFVHDVLLFFLPFFLGRGNWGIFTEQEARRADYGEEEEKEEEEGCEGGGEDRV